MVDIKRVLAAEATLAEITAAHASALDTQIRSLRPQRAVLRTAGRTTEPQELHRMAELTTLTANECRRILDDYLDAVFGDEPNPVADRLRQGAPELPADPTPEQIAAWVELAELLRDPDYIQISRRMAQRARCATRRRPLRGRRGLRACRCRRRSRGGSGRARGTGGRRAHRGAHPRWRRRPRPARRADRNVHGRTRLPYWALVAIVND